MSSFLTPSPPDVDPDEPGESFESVPWESLRFDSNGSNRRQWYVIAGVIGFAAITISAFTRLTPEEPTPLAAPPTVTTLPATTSTTTAPELVTEADLMAVDPTRVERQVMVFAETAIAEYFAADAGGVWRGVEFGTVRSTYTERVGAVSVSDLGGGRYRVLVAASVLDAGEDGMFERRPVRGMTVDVDAGAEPLTVIGLPSPASLPFGRYGGAEDAGVVPTEAVSQAIDRWQPAFGQVEPDSALVVTDQWGRMRVQVVVVDAAGNRWPVSISVTAEGTLDGSDVQP